MPIATLSSVALHYQLIGKGAPVVMIHGLLVGSLAEWYFTAAPPLAAHRRVLLYDLRGHGRSEKAASGYDLATMTCDLASLIEAVGLEGPPSLVGHSYGALIALRYAMERPVAKLVLVEAPLPPSTAELLVPRDVAELPELAKSLPGPLQEAISSGSRRAKRLLDRLAFLTLKSELPEALSREPDFHAADLRSLAAETLCLYGADSRCLEAGRRLAGLLPSGRLVVLPGGHFLPVENPDGCSRHILEFLVG